MQPISFLYLLFRADTACDKYQLCHDFEICMSNLFYVLLGCRDVAVIRPSLIGCYLAELRLHHIRLG